MIIKPPESFLRKRWVYKLADLNLDPLKFTDDEGKDYDKESGKVGNLVAPNIIVSEETAGKTGRKYALFESYAQVYQYCKWIRNSGSFPHLYELCPYFMKLHFDIDIKEDNLEEYGHTLDELNGDVKYYLILRPYLQACVKVFEKLFPLNFNEQILVDNLLVFEAHRSDKISFHIVIDGFYLPCHECWLFYKEVVDHLVHEGMVFQSQMADFSVYKKNQAFRMFGSNKCSMSGSQGLKKIYDGPEIEISPKNVFSRTRMINTSFAHEPFKPELLNLRVLERSLLSHTLGSVRLTLSQTKTNPANFVKVMDRAGLRPEYNNPLDDNQVKTLLDVFFRSEASKTPTGERAFALQKVTNEGLVCMKRTRESFCKVCEKTHENENSFLFSSPTGDVFYVCRRAQESKKGGSKIYVGNLLT